MRTKRQPARQSIWENRFGYLPAALSVGIGLLLAGLAVLSGLLLLSDLSEWISALLLGLLGCVREWLAAGTMFGVVVSRPVLPMASMPAGGFIVLGVLCAVWRALAQKRKAYLTKEARNLVDVHSQKEADSEQ